MGWGDMADGRDNHTYYHSPHLKGGADQGKSRVTKCYQNRKEKSNIRKQKRELLALYPSLSLFWPTFELQITSSADRFGEPQKQFPELKTHKWSVAINFCFWVHDNGKRAQCKIQYDPSISDSPKCLKYQNVPYIRNFWHIRKPGRGFSAELEWYTF